MTKKHFKKLLLVSIIMILMLGSTIPALGAGSSEKVRVFVEFAPGAKGKVQAALKGEGAEFHYTFDDLNSFVVTIPSQALNGLSRNPNVVGIEEDAPRYLVKSTATEKAIETASLWNNVTEYDGAETMPWGVQAVQAPQAWDAATPATGAGITVCIIDTGYYEGHEDLPVSAGGMALLDAPYTNDGNGHGSHVAGTIAAMDNEIGVIGVSPDVSLYIVKYFGNDGLATAASDLIAAANDCAANGADIISMSLSGSRSVRREERAFDTLYASGVLSFGAASNDGVATLHYPASYSSVVSVAALDANENWADFSNFNDAVEIAAPGVDVLSTTSYIDNTYVIVDGQTYNGFHVEFSGRGDVSGALVDGGLCDYVGSWTGAVVLCERGDISFADKVLNVASGGGVASLIYNNEAGELLATMGDFSSPTIGIGFSQETGQTLMTKLGSTADVSSTIAQPANGYESWQGTSMATPHASAVAALVWSANISATNVEIREAINASAKDLGAAGRDVYFGYGMIQAANAIAYLGGGPVNTAPSVAISSPADGSTFDSGATVSFAGSASDTEDGDLSGSIAWTSSIDGAIGTGTGASVSAALSDGTHTITASVTDSGGLSDSDAITVTVESGTPVNTAPSVAITAPANGSTYDSGATVNFAGSASDTEDGDLSGSISWTSSIDGTIGSGASASAVLSEGTHTITASVTDSGGLSDSDSITVTVSGGSTGGDLFVDVVTDAASYGDRQWVTITITVTDGSTGVANANVSTTITTANGTKSYSNITDASGVATVTYKTFIRKDGAGTFTVDVVASLSGYTDGVGATTFEVQ